MSHFYHVTAQKPTVVVASCTGHFTGSDDLNLVVAKNTFLEIYEVTAEGLKLIREVSIYGKIVAIRLFRQKNKATDSLFILTRKAEAAIIDCQKDKDGNFEFITVASGSFEEKAGQVTENFKIHIDPEQKLLIIQFYMGLLKVIPLNCVESASAYGDANDLLVYAYSVRMEEFYVIDMAFLNGYNLPTFAVMFEDVNGLHIKAYELADGRLNPVAWHASSIEPDSALLIPVPGPHGGALVVGLQAVCYHSKDAHYIAQVIPQAKHCAMICYTTVDDVRYLLGDMAGRLYMVHLVVGGPDSESSTARITAIRVELLGETAIPKSISYLDNAVIFIGSWFGDSQLIRLNPEGDERWNYVTVLETFTNIGPVVDMLMIDRDKQGQNQLITASGAYKEGSLRVIRNGIGIHEHASIDQELIKAVWCFRFNLTEFDDTIIISLVGQTQILSLNQDDIEPLELEGFQTSLQTYHCAMVSPDQLIQVTDCARLLGTGRDGTRSGLLDTWKPPSRRSVSHCGSYGNQVVVASGADLFYLRVDNAKFNLISSVKLDHEVACLDLTPFHTSGSDTDLPPVESKLVAVGLWLDFAVVLLTLPDLRPFLRESLDSNVIPRSVLITQFEDTPYLFVAMGDGTLIYYVMDTTTGSLRESKRVNVGTGPMFLRQWRSQSKNSVFVCSDHPCIVYSANNKLVFANVNLKEVTYMCPLHSEYYRDCLALVSSSCLIFGSVDDIQKLHVRTIHLEETPKRLVAQEETSTLGVITYRQETLEEGVGFVPVRPSVSVASKPGKSHSSLPKVQPVAGGPGGAGTRERDEVEVSSFLVLDQSGFEVTHAHTFHYSPTCSETAVSLTSCRLEGVSEPVFVVGTVYVFEEEGEPHGGRIHVFRLTDRLETLAEMDVDGAPYAIVEYNGKLLAAINSSVRLLEYRDNALRIVCGHYENVLCMYLERKGDFVLVGDLMRSVSVLLFKASINGFEMIGCHRRPRWTTAVSIVDDDHFLASDTDFNLYVVTKDSDPTAAGGADDKRKLVECAFLHTGEYINKFVHGNLIMQNTTERGLPVCSPVMHGTVNGSLGMLCQISEPLFHFLKEVETRLARLVKSVGQLSHDGWRAFKTERSTRSAEKIIDGDLIEAFLDLGAEDRDKVVADGLMIPKELLANDTSRSEETTKPCEVGELVKIVEELNRLH